MNELALFAGAGGGILGSYLSGWRTVAAVEIEEYPRAILLQRQADGILPRFPIWDDIRTFDGKPWKGKVDIITGGFPCQDISSAGKGEGLAGERSGLWSEMERIIGETEPRGVFVENSSVLTGRGLDVVLMGLAEMGYDAEWGVLGAHSVGAPHKRDRAWILAYSNAWCPTEREPEERSKGFGWWDINPGKLPDTYDKRSQRRRAERELSENKRKMQAGRGSRGDDKPGLGRMVDGLADRLDFIETAFGGKVPSVAHDIEARVDRIKAIGNGQVPMTAVQAYSILNKRRQTK